MIEQVEAAYKQAKALFRYHLRGFENNITVKEIPENWEKFLDTEDSWIRVDLPMEEKTTSCFYKAMKGSQFPPHHHRNSTEHLVVMEGKIEVFTKKRNIIIEAPNAVKFDIGEGHAIQFLDNSKILCMWHPEMNGWEANKD